MGHGNQRYRPDSKFYWIYLAAATMSFFVLGGYLKGFGIFFSAFLEEFEAQASVVSLILGVRAVVYALTSPLATSFCDRFTERAIIFVGGILHFCSNVLSSQSPNIEVLIFANGVLGGLAVAFTFGPVQVATGKYFHKRKSLAMSLTFCGATLGQIVMSPLIVKMMETFGLRGTLLIYGALLLHQCVAGALARPVKSEPPSIMSSNTDGTVTAVPEKAELIVSKERLDQVVWIKQDDQPPESPPDPEAEQKDHLLTNGMEAAASNPGNAPTTQTKRKCQVVKDAFKFFLDFSLCKKQRYVLYLISSSFTFVPMINVMIYLYPRALETGISPSSAAMLLTILGGCELVGRFSIGFLSDLKTLGPLKIYVFCTFLSGVVVLLLAFTDSFVLMGVLCGFLGLLGSAPIILGMPITVEIVSMPRMAKGLAFTSFFHGIFNTVTPPVLGLLRDVSGSYSPVFYICGGVMMLGSLIMALDPIIRRYQKRTSERLPADVVS